MSERVVEVDKHWLAQLGEYLRPEERWVDPNTNSSLVLYAYAFGCESYKLVFVPAEENPSNEA